MRRLPRITSHSGAVGIFGIFKSSGGLDPCSLSTIRPGALTPPLFRHKGSQRSSAPRLCFVNNFFLCVESPIISLGCWHNLKKHDHLRNRRSVGGWPWSVSAPRPKLRQNNLEVLPGLVSLAYSTPCRGKCLRSKTVQAPPCV